MPRSSIFHRNRSQASLSTQDANDRTSHQASPIDAPLHSPVFPRSSVASSLGPNEDGARYDQPYRLQEARGTAGVQRSQSQRVQQPTIHLVPSPSQGSAESPAFDGNPDSHYQQRPTPVSHTEEPKRRGLFSLKNSSIAKEPAKEPANNASGNRPGRSISVRKKVSAPGGFTELTPATFVTSSYDQEEAQGRANFDHLHLQSRPPPPEKDLRLNQPPLSTQSERPLNRLPLQGVSTQSFSRQTLERQRSSTSSVREHAVSTAAQLQQLRAPPEQTQQPPIYQPSPSSATSTSTQPLHQQSTSYQPSPSSASSTSSHPLQSRAQQGALQQLYIEKKTSRPSSQLSFGPPSPLRSSPRAIDGYQPGLSTNPGPPTPYSQGLMGPPPSQHQQPPNRRSDESAPQPQSAGLSRESSAYQAYHHGAQGQSQQPGAPLQYGSQLGVNSSQGNNQRGAPQSSPMAPQNTSDHDRSTPPPSRSRDDLIGMDFAQLSQRHDELRKSACTLHPKVMHCGICKTKHTQQKRSTAKSRNTTSTKMLKCNNYKTLSLTSASLNLAPLSTITNTLTVSSASTAPLTTLPSTFVVIGAPCLPG